MAAVALLALPGLPALVEPAISTPAARPPVLAHITPASAAAWRETARAASDATAWVAFAESGPERIVRAGQAAARVRALAGESGAPAQVVGALNDLAAALEAYDLDAIRAASARLADLRANAPYHKEP
jgi:hypothetical protein